MIQIVGTSRPMDRTNAAAPGMSGGRGLVVWGLGMLLALLLATPAAGQFSAQPVIMELRTEASPTESAIAVINDSDEPMQFQVYVADFDQSPDGAHSFMEPGTLDRSCADRVEVFPTSVVVEAGGRDEVRVRMSPGDESCWSMVFVQSVNSAESGIRVAQRIGVKVYGVAGAVSPAGEVREVAASPSRDEVLVSFANTGEAPARPQGELEVRTEAGELVGVLQVPPFSVLPGRTTRTRVPVTLDLAPGRYLLIPILDFGGDYLAGGQGILEVTGG